MFEVTEKANEMFEEFFKDKDGTPYVRVFLSEGGWSGPSMGMALDEPRDGDEIIEENTITYLINRELFEQAKPISIDFIDSAMGSGFSVASNMCGGGECGASCGH